MVQIHNSITQIKDFEVGFSETSDVIVEIKKQRAIIVVIYVPPRVDKLEFVYVFYKVLKRLASYHLPIIMCGDFNIDIRKQNKLVAEYQSPSTSNKLTILSDLITIITESPGSCIDHFIVKDFNNPSIKIIDETLSDHYPIYFEYFRNQIHEPNKNFPRHIFR